MKKILIIAAAVILSCGFALRAADQPSTAPGDKGSEKGLKMGRGEMGLGMYQQLNLTDEQKAKIQEIMKSRHTQLQALREDKTLTKEQIREKSKAIMESTQKQMDEVLTPEQREKMQQIRAEWEKKAKERWQQRNKENKPAAETK